MRRMCALALAVLEDALYVVIYSIYIYVINNAVENESSLSLKKKVPAKCKWKKKEKKIITICEYIADYRSARAYITPTYKTM